MIIDVSHLNEKSFWDVLSHSSKPIIATHSNTRNYANVDRNLTSQQVKALIHQKGLMGLNAAKYFVHDDTSLQNVHYLAKHARVMADLGGLDCIAVGFDFMDYLNPPFGKDVMAKEIQDASESQNLISALYELGFSETEVQKIAYINVLNFLEENLK
jgi:membrane dipeptidase